MRARQKIGDVASINVGGILRPGRIAAMDARDALLVLADGQMIARPRITLRAVHAVRKAFGAGGRVGRKGLAWSHGPGKRRKGWPRR